MNHAMPAQSTNNDVAPGSIGAAVGHERWSAGEVSLWLLPVLIYFLLPGHLVLGSQVLITGLFVLSLDLLIGYSGIVSLGHAAFFGTGAYTAGLLAKAGYGEPLSGLIVAGAVAALLGWSLSFVVVRGHGLTQLMVTLGLGELLFEGANKAVSITGGVDGLYGVQMWKLLGYFEFDLWGRVGYLYSLVVLFSVYLILRRLLHSPFGLALRGLRENPQRMPALGAPIARRRIEVFTLAAGVAGVAGALLAQTTQFVGIDTLSFHRSAEALVILVLGGAGKLYGALLGAGVYMIMHSLLSELDPAYWQFWIGVLLVAVVLFARGGIMGALEALVHRISRGRT